MNKEIILQDLKEIRKHLVNDFERIGRFIKVLEIEISQEKLERELNKEQEK